MKPEWLTVWLDFSAAELDAGQQFWERMGAPLSGPGPLRVSSSSVGTSRVRLGLGVIDVDAAISEARAAGASPSNEAEPGNLRSPAGFVFTIEAVGPDPVAHPVAVWAQDHHARVDQLTIDVAPGRWTAELGYWRRLTGWEVTVGSGEQFARLHTPPAFPVRILLQRKMQGATSAHLDIATDNRRAEVARLERAGARRLWDGARWTVLRPPAGWLVCVTDRRPETGLLAP